MRAALSRIALLLCLLTTTLLAQAPPPRTNPEAKDEPKDLGPATSQTTEKAGDAVKLPVGPTPMPTAAPVDPSSFELGAQDILLIRVWREPELSSAVEIRPDGKISLPLIGEVQAAGVTAEALKTKIVELLSEYINKPEVMVSIQAVRSRRYHISGEVSRPGTFPLVVPVTVLEALTNAGGFREFANTKRITILRKGKIFKFNYNDVVKGKNMEQNILLENGDFINIP